MRITIAAVGRWRRGALPDLFEDYAGRLNEAALGRLTLREVEEKRALPPDKLKEREAELLLAALPEGARLVALDEGGRSLDSAAFAAWLGRARDDGLSDLAFVIGGADGLAPSVRDRAALTLSLGAMTWPHMLVRVMLAEQLYRAQTILTGHPYHRA